MSNEGVSFDFDGEQQPTVDNSQFKSELEFNAEVNSEGADNNFGFQPAQNMGGVSTAPRDDDFTEEERSQVEEVEQANEDRKKKLFERQSEEENKKQQKKSEAKSKLDEWQKTRKNQIDQKRKQNKEEEKYFLDDRSEQRKGANPWERVINNCEMNSSQYVGDKDVSRMKNAMLSRKTDITKAGGMKNTM